MEWPLLLAILLLMCGIASGAIAQSKGRSFGRWFVLGVLFGFFAIAAALGASSRAGGPSGRSQQCPSCLSSVPLEASVCRYCQRELPTAQTPTPFAPQAWPRSGEALQFPASPASPAQPALDVAAFGTLRVGHTKPLNILVSDHMTQRVVSGVGVLLNGRQVGIDVVRRATTDYQGMARFDDLRPTTTGEVAVSVGTLEYLPRTVSVPVSLR